VIERVLPLSEARRVCASKGAPADACAWISNGACHLIVPRNGPVRDRAAYRRHEMAHCNGWDTDKLARRLRRAGDPVQGLKRLRPV
jgi:hypothetical protein